MVYRFFIAVLDLTIFSFLASFTVTFLEKFTETENSESLPLIIFSFYSIIIIAIEYYFDGSLTKILFGIRNVRQGGKKINLFSYIIKFFLRFIALFFGYLYLATLFIVLLIIIRIFGGLKSYYGIAGDFINGVMKKVWYDDIIKQNVIYIKK